MGQISLPVINKSGINSHWDSSGDSTYEMSLFYSKDYYIRNLITYLMKCNIELKRYTPNAIKDLWFCNIIRIDEIHKEYYLRPNLKKFRLHILGSNYLPFYDEFISTSHTTITNSLNKVLPCYICKLLILKSNNTLVIVNRYIQVKRGSWELRCKKANDKFYKARSRYYKSRKGKLSKYSPSLNLDLYLKGKSF